LRWEKSRHSPDGVKEKVRPFANFLSRARRA